MKKLVFVLLIAVLSHTTFSQTKEEIKISNWIEGTLLVPKSSEPLDLAIIIAGSGPTDRDGNQMMMNNNSLKFLANELSNEGIATFRYDKRIVKQLKNRNIDERKISLDDFIQDAIDAIQYFKNDNRFRKIFVIGHSQGSLVGMVAAQDTADGFISIAGAGQPIDGVIVDQLAKQAPGLEDNARAAFDEMRANGKTTNYSQGLSSIFRAALQPFMLTWMKYNPQEELKKLSMPVLIVNGDRDLQVQVSEAELLRSARSDGSYHIIENMNHILKTVEGDDLDNQKSYNEPSRKVNKQLIEVISSFILKS